MIRRQVWTSFHQHLKQNGLQILSAGVIMAVVYAISALSSYPRLLVAAGKRLDSTEVIPSLLVVVMVLVMLFSVTFLTYFNTLLIARRDREIGLKRLLGESTWHMGLCLMLESWLTGLAVLGFSLVIGISLFPLLAMVVVRLMGLQLTVSFFVSWRAIRDVAILTFILYTLVGAINAIYIRGPLKRFLRPASVSQVTRLTSGWRLWVGLVGTILLVAGLYAFGQYPLTSRYMAPLIGRNDWLLVALLLVILVVGLYWVFRFFLPAMMRRTNTLRHFAIADGRMISRILISKRIYNHAHSLWLTTVLTAVTVGLLGSTVMMYRYSQEFDLRQIPTTIVAAGDGIKDVKTIMAAQHTRVTASLTIASKLEFGEMHLRDQANQVRTINGVFNVIALSDYRRAAKIQKGLPPLTLHAAQAQILVPTRVTFRAVGRRVTNPNRRITLRSSHKQLQLVGVSNVFPTGGNNFFDRGLVVSDVMYAQLIGTADPMYMAQLPHAATTTALEKALQRLDSKRNLAELVHVSARQRAGAPLVVTNRDQASGSTFWRAPFGVKSLQQGQTTTLFGLGLFLILLLSGVFVIATGSILLLKQVLTANQEVRSFQILKRMGMRADQLERTVYRETGVIFALPLVFGTVIGLSFMRLLGQSLDDPPSWVAVIAILMYVVVYSIFYFVTARLTLRLVNQPVAHLTID